MCNGIDHDHNDEQVCAKNEIKIEVLPDGSIKIYTGSFDNVVHTDAERLVLNLKKAYGGEAITEKRKRISHQDYMKFSNLLEL
jgi:hypothetical protein